MSVRRLRLDVAPSAQDDVRSIRVFSLEQWGDERATDYISALNRAFQTLRDNPHLGAAKDGLYPGLRAFPVERHVLYYRIKGDLIEIVRVLHAKQDAAAAFRAAPPL